MGLNIAEDITKEVLEEKFKRKTQQEWVEMFKDLDACVSPVLTLNEAAQHQHNIERKSFVKIDDQNYLPNMPWLNMDLSSRSFEMPLIGEHTSHILKENGYSKEEIDKFISEKVISESLDKNNKAKSKL